MVPGRPEKSLERFVVSPDGKLIAFFGNHGYIMLVSADSKHVRHACVGVANACVDACSLTPGGIRLALAAPASSTTSGLPT